MISNEIISKLEEKGFKRWQKGINDRLYINAGQIGLTCTYYHTGNIHRAEFSGMSISNCEARRMKAARTYIDVTTGRVHSDNDTLQRAVERILERLKDDEDKGRTTVTIPVIVGVWETAEQAAASKGIEISEYIESLIRQDMDQKKEEEK